MRTLLYIAGGALVVGIGYWLYSRSDRPITGRPNDRLDLSWGLVRK